MTALSCVIASGCPYQDRQACKLFRCTVDLALGYLADGNDLAAMPAAARALEAAGLAERGRHHGWRITAKGGALLRQRRREALAGASRKDGRAGAAT